jgi:hypothetical protein
MQRHSRIDGIIDAVVSRLLRMLAHPHVITEPLIHTYPAHAVPHLPISRSTKIAITLHAHASDAIPAFRARLSPDLSAIAPTPRRIIPKMIPRLRILPVMDPPSSHVKSLTGTMVQIPEVMDHPFTFTWRMQRSRNFRILPTQSKKEIFSPLSTSPARQEPPIVAGYAAQDVNAICDIPIAMKPVPWEKINRDMILACWELFRGQAVEELGISDSKSLEMLAIYPQVDLSRMRKTGYDPASRELHLYPKYPDSMHQASKDDCVIIVGTVRGTGRLLQATLRLP